MGKRSASPPRAPAGTESAIEAPSPNLEPSIFIGRPDLTTISQSAEKLTEALVKQCRWATVALANCPRGSSHNLAREFRQTFGGSRGAHQCLIGVERRAGAHCKE